MTLASKIVGGTLDKEYTIWAPGASHRARFMAKIIYVFKIYLFRKQLSMEASDLLSLQKFVLFVIKVYTKKWFECPSPIKAPINDLNFLKDIIKYENIDKNISSVALNSFLNHTWYLSENLCGLSLFDQRISAAEKNKMVKALSTIGNANPPHNPILVKKNILKLKLCDLRTSNSKILFTKFKIQTDFLNTKAAKWQKND